VARTLAALTPDEMAATILMMEYSLRDRRIIEKCLPETVEAARSAQAKLEEICDGE